MGLAASRSIPRERLWEKGFWQCIGAYANRLRKAIVPTCLFAAADGVLVEMAEVCPGKIPTRSGYHTRIATPADLPGLCTVSPQPHAFVRLFESGALCILAENEDGIAALVWAQIGPGDCTVDASYKHGYRWRLQAGEAWIHNGISHPDVRNTCRGWVYIVAFRRLLEELAARGVSRCYGLISQANTNSLNVHRRLHLEPIVSLSYRRLLFWGRYQFCREGTRTVLWTLRPSLTVNLSDLGTCQGRVSVLTGGSVKAEGLGL
jgi:hypothetical protein